VTRHCLPVLHWCLLCFMLFFDWKTQFQPSVMAILRLQDSDQDLRVAAAFANRPNEIRVARRKAIRHVQLHKKKRHSSAWDLRMAFGPLSRNLGRNRRIYDLYLEPAVKGKSKNTPKVISTNTKDLPNSPS
jgi:hypothetical protein